MALALLGACAPEEDPVSALERAGAAGTAGLERGGSGGEAEPRAAAEAGAGGAGAEAGAGGAGAEGGAVAGAGAEGGAVAGAGAEGGAVAGAGGVPGGAAGTGAPPTRGAVIAVDIATSLSATQIDLQLSLASAPFTAEHDVSLYQLRYGSVDPTGAPTELSALLAVPEGTSEEDLTLLSYQHGTILPRLDAPSVVDADAPLLVLDNPEAFIGAAFAARGWFAVVPDYIGLGVSTEVHPYLHADSEASAVVDALRAARQAAATVGVSVSRRLFLCGYSQGGHATMAAHRAIERDFSDELSVVAAAPMAGPYDLSGTTFDAFLQGQETPEPFEVPYLLLSYNHLYDLGARDEDLFVDEVATTLPGLFDGVTDRDTINEAMVPVGQAPPKDPLASVSPALIAALRDDPAHPFIAALRDNDVYDWAPAAPIQLYQCSGDRTVPPENAAVALARLTANGASVELLEPPEAAGGDHEDCVLPSLFAAETWFESLR